MPVGREEAVDIIDDFGKQPAEGFEGMLTLLPTDDPNKATFVTLWDSEQSMLNGQRGVAPRPPRPSGAWTEGGRERSGPRDAYAGTADPA